MTHLAGELSGRMAGLHLSPASRNYLQRSDPRPGKTANNFETDDVQRFQFWPVAVAMGSLAGRQFTQVFGAGCDNVPDSKGNSRSMIAFDLRREQLVIRAKMKLDPRILPAALNPLDAELSFDDITSHGIHITQRPQEPSNPRSVLQVTVTVSCRRPPKFFTPFGSEEERKESFRQSGRKQVFRRRATALDFAVSGVNERDAGPIPAIPEGPCAYPTFWNTYRWVFLMSDKEYARLRLCASSIRALSETDPEIRLMANIPEYSHHVVSVLSGAEYGKQYTLPDLSRVPFSTRTLIEGLVGHSILKPVDVVELVRSLKRVAVVPAFQDRILEALYNQERIRDVKALVPKMASFLRRKAPYSQAHLVLIRTVLVTPTRLLIGPPQQEPSNSVTRKYNDKLDGIIRVQFTDEEDRMFIADYVKQADMMRPEQGIMARVRRALQYGIVVGGETFYPVASSASQQKEHAMWFINPRAIDGLQLRSWMGTVHETVVAKHAARMGLPFSTSRIVKMKIEVGPQLPDVERNGWTFTDGVAVAGKEVLKQAALALGEKKGLNLTPSAIQFRLGGAKGVLGDWPHLAKPYEIRLRPSLIKFDSTLADLNVVRLAKYQVAFLNRQFINIMCANGVPEELMIEIFEQAVAHIKGLTERVRTNQMTKGDHEMISACADFPVAQLIKSGFNQDPLVLDVASIIECRALQDLKWRARVRLPDGVFLIGIADETGLLKEGEVFCQFQENDDTPPKVVVDGVLVCRAPALHPGDVRRAKAVDIPQLRHLKNVIVFSTQGERDLPNMLGGGDLDGDDYTIIWDQRFVQTLNVFDPMDYTAPKPIRVDKVTQSHLNENFVQYILNDVLGQVDNCHLALSDRDSPFDVKCLHLSEVHSIAVDFAKTGQAATLDPSLRPKQWPDFMDKDDTKMIYQSKGILGKLFRIVQPDPHYSPNDIKSMGYPTDARITQYPLHESLLEILKPIKASYEKDLHFDMRRYRVFEPEIPSGIAIRNKRRKRARDQNLNEPLRDAYLLHVNNVRQAAMAAVKDITFRTKLSAAQVVARHCYALTYEKKYVQEWEEQLSQGQWHGHVAAEDEDYKESLRPKPLISFAWCFWQELLQIVNLSKAATVTPAAELV